MNSTIILEDLILPFALAILSSGAFTALLTSYFSRRKIIAEAFEATGQGAKHLVAGSMDLVEEYRKAFNEQRGRISGLETEVRQLNKRLDEKTEEWLQALAFKSILEEKAIEQGKQIENLERQVADLQSLMIDRSTS